MASTEHPTATPVAPPALHGTRVLELTTGLPGAQCGRLLAMLGAEVVKIESPGRPDRARLAGSFPHDVPDPERSALHRYLNARKQSAAIDVDQPSGRELVWRLAGTADVLLDDGALGTPPDVAAVYADLRARHERLIVAAFSPYGLDGPKAGWASSELTALAAGGWLTPHQPGEPPVMPGSSAAPLGVGTLGALGVLLALAARARLGTGQLVEVPENEALLSLLSLPTTVFAYLGRDDVRIGDRHPFGIYPCADGHVGVNILTQRHWEGLCQLMGRPDLADDPRLADGDLRAAPEAVEVIDRAIRDWVADKPAQATFEAGQAMRVPIAIVPSPRQVLDSAQYAARDYWHDHVDSLLGPLRVPGPPYRGAPGSFAPFAEAPARGSSTGAVLDELDLDDGARLALASLGVIAR